MTAAGIEAAVERAGLQPLTSDAARHFETYLELLLKWNARLNLTAIREPEGILERHFLECIFVAQQLPSGIKTLLDFGSGGGFPGIPFAICRPEIHVTLGESQSKKAAFLREVVRTLNLANVDVFNGRVEALNQRFDAAALRAVDKMLEACRAAEPKIAPHGHFILFVTKDSAPSLAAEFDQIIWAAPLPIPNSDQRILLMGRKAQP
jgi:16S rRNA (guanine527-N7)-methyltransferase